MRLRIYNINKKSLSFWERFFIKADLHLSLWVYALGLDLAPFGLESRIRTKINLAETILAMFKARGGERCNSIVSDESKQKIAKIVPPEGNAEIGHFLLHSSSAYPRGYSLVIIHRKCLNFSVLRTQN